MHWTREAAHQTLEFRFEIDAELKKAEERRQRAMVPAAGRFGAGALEETHQFWRQVQLSMLYHTFQLRNDIRALKNIAPVPATKMLISLDKFNNTLSAGADNDNPLGFLEAADNQEEEEGEEGEDDDEDDEDDEQTGQDIGQD
jgi:hypothetical protein